MKKLLLVIFIAVSFTYVLRSQPCYPDGIIFSTQAEIDSFKSANPDCSEIGGEVIISGDEIVNLDSLIPFVSIGGDLLIKNNDNLENLEGLSNLKFLGGSLIIKSNHSLTSFHGLEGLDTIYNLWLYYNVPGITNMQGLNGLKIINGEFYISEHYYLEDFSGLDSLSSIGGRLYVGNNNGLQNLKGLEKLSSIGGYCVLLENDALKNVDALSSLNSLGDELAFVMNDSLVSIDGIANIDASTIAELYIEHNPMLSECDVESICNYLAAPNGYTNINGNAAGCNSIEEVEEACGITATNEIVLSDDLLVYPNPAKEFTRIYSNSKLVEISLYNLCGELILREYPALTSYQLKTSMLTPGIYNLRLVTDDSAYSKRLIVQ